MSAPRAITVTCRGTPSGRRQWYGALARLIASGTAPTAALIESSSESGSVRVTVRPFELVDVIGRSLAGTTVRIGRCRSTAPQPPAALSASSVGMLVRPDGPPAIGVGSAGLQVDRVGIAAAVPAGTWLGLQTFWLPGRRGRLWLARRFLFAARSSDEVGRRFDALGAAVAAEWSLSVGSAATFCASRHRAFRDWNLGATRTLVPGAWVEGTPDAAARSTVSMAGAVGTPTDLPVETPAIVFGASGAGKTTYLARWAARAVRQGNGLFVLDLHGDLAPAILVRLPPEHRDRVVAVDATLPPVPGIAGLVPHGPRDRAAAHLVAALKRLSPDGTDLYWGFRLERIFDSFVRLALESGGTLTDVYDLLTNADRRDTYRLATRSGELARFLDELAPVVRRNPEFLWSAATRLSKVVLVPALRELLAPEDGGLPVETLLAQGRPVLVRLPFATLGPEAAGFAATLLLGRVYLGIASRTGRRPAVSVVLDEVQALSPRLVAELLSEGRKFGLRTVVATQYPARLARELENAARGALRGFVAFRVPRPTALEVGAWLGLAPGDSVELLSNLPTGQGLVLDSLSDGVRPTTPEPTTLVAEPEEWRRAADGTRGEFSVTASSIVDALPAEQATEQILLAVLSGCEANTPLHREDVVDAATRLPGPRTDPALLGDRLGALLRDCRLLDQDAGTLRLTPAGERWLGLTVPTGATRETAEHRALLMAAFRRFARRGYRLEILRQGRFDTTLPDARLRQLPAREQVSVPADLAFEVERARTSWAWRFFHGRDVHVEAEVSGALRAERVRHGVRKALRSGAFVLFVVGDAHRARRVRAVLRSMGLGVDRAQVWTLPTRSEPGPGTNR